MDKILDKFWSHLEREYEYLERYLEVLKRQTGHVVGVNIDDLQGNAEAFEQLSEKQPVLAESRASHFKALAEFFQIPIESITITRIIEKANSEWAGKLSEYKEKLLAIIEQIQNEVKTNEFLLGYALDYTHQLIKMNDDALTADLVYSKKGRKETRPDQIKLLDQRI